MRILVADDHDLVRETVAAFLLAEGMEVVTMVAAMPEVIAALRAARHDVALIDAGLPGIDGLRGLELAVTEGQGAAVALMAASTSRELAEAALEAGAAGFVPKKMSARAMVAAVRLMARGERFLPMGLLTSDAAPGGLAFGLTGRELTVLRGICAGKSNKEIARDLTLQEVTVKLHVKTLTRKLAAKNRTHAAMIARDSGLA
ncbi:MAG: response regulator transcription factor [Paracoccaceae bacterium]|nr:MAG: response regulator transcription factor [Paracoccaceae bacterium]